MFHVVEKLGLCRFKPASNEVVVCWKGHPDNGAEIVIFVLVSWIIFAKSRWLYKIYQTQDETPAKANVHMTCQSQTNEMILDYVLDYILHLFDTRLPMRCTHESLARFYGTRLANMA